MGTIFSVRFLTGKKLQSTTIEQLVRKSFKIAATEGTASFLTENGLHVEKVVKGSEDVNELFRNEKLKAVINIPNQGRNNQKFGFYIREQASPLPYSCFYTYRYC